MPNLLVVMEEQRDHAAKLVKMEREMRESFRGWSRREKRNSPSLKRILRR